MARTVVVVEVVAVAVVVAVAAAIAVGVAGPRYSRTLAGQHVDRMVGQTGEDYHSMWLPIGKFQALRAASEARINNGEFFTLSISTLEPTHQKETLDSIH